MYNHCSISVTAPYLTLWQFSPCDSETDTQIYSLFHSFSDNITFQNCSENDYVYAWISNCTLTTKINISLLLLTIFGRVKDLGWFRLFGLAPAALVEHIGQVWRAKDVTDNAAAQNLRKNLVFFAFLLLFFQRTHSLLLACICVREHSCTALTLIWEHLFLLLTHIHTHTHTQTYTHAQMNSQAYTLHSQSQ